MVPTRATGNTVVVPVDLGSCAAPNCARHFSWLLSFSRARAVSRAVSNLILGRPDKRAPGRQAVGAQKRQNIEIPNQARDSGRHPRCTARESCRGPPGRE